MKMKSGKNILLLLFGAVTSLHSEAWTPGYQVRVSCGTLVTGGSGYSSIKSAETWNEFTLYDIQAGTKEPVRSLDSNFYDIQLSLSCKWIAVTQVFGVQKELVRIVTRSGDDVRTILNARRSVWGRDSTGADCIAYIVGEDTESEGFVSKGTWILSIQTGEQLQIHARGYDVAWAEFDQCFYIADVGDSGSLMGKVVRYSLKDKNSKVTPYYGIDFSMNGTYYHTRTDSPSDLKVYFRATNENISARYLPIFERCFNGNPSCWLNDRMIVFPAYSQGEKSRIVDFDRTEAWEVPERLLGFADKDEKSLLILDNGEIVSRKFEDVARLIYPLPAEVGTDKSTAEEGADER